MKYDIKLFKPSGKIYTEEDSIFEDKDCLYTKIPNLIEKEYKNILKEGWMVLVEDETGAAHIFKEY